MCSLIISKASSVPVSPFSFPVRKSLLDVFHVYRMRVFRCNPLLYSFLALLPYALGWSDFQFFSNDDPTEDIFPFEETFDDAFTWEGNSDDIFDSSFFLDSDCSAYFPSIDGKRIRRGDSSSGFCPAGSTADEGQKSGNGDLGTGSSDEISVPNFSLEDFFSIPALATYHNPRNDDCFRLTNGQLPLAVCHLQGSTDYYLDGQLYRDLDYSYPTNAPILFSSPSFTARPNSTCGGGGSSPRSYDVVRPNSTKNIHVYCWLVPFNSLGCPSSTIYCCASFDGLAASKKCRQLALLDP